jgi:hypothetical protein
MTTFGVFIVVGKSFTVNSKNREKRVVKVEDENGNKISMLVDEREYESYEIGLTVSLHSLMAQTTLKQKEL